MNLRSPKLFGTSLFDKFFSYLDSLQPVDRVIFGTLLLVFLVATTYNFYVFARGFLVEVPVSGGTLVEGTIGSPRFINPVLAITRADNDLVALTHSGLLRLGEDGTLENDLAESITISEDGLVYNIIMHNDRYFHDGVKVTAEDVAFTIGLVQKASLKSPLRGNWSGVTVEVINSQELNLVLENPYAPFRENLTLGIMPKHIWQTLSDEEFPFSQHNVEPIGSGPYKISAITRNSAGLASEYQLELADDYRPDGHIKNIAFRFYQNEEEVISALKAGEITSTASLSERWLTELDREKFNFTSEPLPRVFSIFFNQNRNPVLRDESARKALNLVIDREELISRAVNGFGKPTNTPIPADWVDLESEEEPEKTDTERITEATQVLRDGGWVQNQSGRWEKEIDGASMPLVLTVRSANGVLFEKMASYLSETWQSLGAEVTFEFYEQSDLVQTIIRPRDYQALLFGMDVGRSLDLYPFWHSGSREDPGLNVSLYANIAVDNLVTQMRTATSTEARDETIRSFVTEIENEQPAIFLFTPSFEYVTEKNIIVAPMKKIQKPSERFSNVTDWYINQSGVWPIFVNNDN